MIYQTVQNVLDAKLLLATMAGSPLKEACPGKVHLHVGQLRVAQSTPSARQPKIQFHYHSAGLLRGPEEPGTINCRNIFTPEFNSKQLCRVRPGLIENLIGSGKIPRVCCVITD